MNTFNKLICVSICAFCLLISTNTFSQVTIDSENFESGWGIWNDGGNDCQRTNTGTPNGTWSIDIQDNSGVASSMTTNNIDITPYTSVDFTFDFEAVSMENGEDFWVQYSSNGGASYTTIATYTRGTNFNNNTAYTPTVSIDTGSYTFATNSRFRIRCDASGNADDVYIDNVLIQGYTPSGPEINIQGNTTTIADGDTTPNVADDTDYGNVDVTSGTVTNTFTIQNLGTSNLSLTNPSPYVTITGHTADFTLTANPTTPIAASGSTTFTITFNPTVVGLRSATVSIANDDSNENPYTFDIQGTGTTPSYCASNGNNTNDEYISRVQLSTIDNSSGVGTTSTGYSDFTAISTTLTATSNYTITVTPTWPGTTYAEGYSVWIDWNQDYDFADAGEQVFTQTATTASPISGVFTVPGTATLGTTRMRVSMKYNGIPTECESFAYGEVEDYTIVIASASPTPEIDIIGNAVSIADGDITPNVADDTDFGSADITVGTVVNTFTIQNTGTGTLNLAGASPYVVVSGANAADFTVTAIPANSIASSGSTTFNITFNPSALGLRTATLTIVNDDADENPYNFNIQGTGTTTTQEINITGNATTIADGDITPNVADDTDFGNVDVTSGTAVNTFTIENLGSSIALNLTAASPYIAISGTNAADFSVTAIPSTPIAAGGNTTFNITFNPSALGLRTATLTIANDDGDENPYNFDIQGTGTDNCGGYITTFPYTEDFESGIGVWTQDTGDNFDWTNDSAGTPTGATGPSTANSGTYYMYTEASGNNSNTANLITPCFDLTGTTNPRLTVFVHMYGANTGTLNLDLSTDSGLTYPTNLWTQTGQVQNASNSSWTPISVDLSSYIGQTIKIRIQGIVGAGNTSDMAIDSFSITDKPNPTTGPGGITTDLAIWLKGTNGLGYTDGQSVSLWQDQGRGSDARTHVSGQEPTYRDNATKNVNFNPVIEFDNSYATYTSDTDYSHDNTSSQFLTGDYGLYTQEMFIVLVTDDTPITNNFGFMDVFCGDAHINTNAEDATGIGFGYYTGRVNGEIICYAHDSYTNSEAGDGYAVAEIGTGSSYDNLGIINTRNNSANTQQELYYNANNIETTQNDIAEYMNTNDTRYWIGRSEGWEASLNARVAEVISFKTRLNDTDLTQARNRVQSYLGIKYGITLGVNGTSQDYVDSIGSMIWNQSVNTGYNYDIAGIGRDDASGLNQKQSSSINNGADGTGPTEGILTIGLTDIYNTNNLNVANNTNILNDREYLVWGNNGANLNLAASTVTINMSAGITPALTTNVTFTAMQRNWKVVENGGDIGKVKISIPQNAVRNITPPGDYLMFISDTGVFDPTADYRIMTLNGSNLETEYDFDGTKYITFGYAPQVIVERSIYFDGAVDYVDMEDALDLNTTNFTLSSWIKRDTGTNNASILSKRDATYTEGYDFKINSTGRLEFILNGGVASLTSSIVIPENEWHHVAVIYNSGNASLYIDGVADTSASSLPAPISTMQSFYIAAAGKSTPTAHFAGNIDEVRVWDTNLSVDQLRYVMNQEIEDNISFVNGKVIPQTITKNDVASIPWSNLAGYYPMSIYTYTNTNDESGNGNQGALRNLDTVDRQTAPLPYQSQANGNWTTDATWLNNNVQTLPNSLSIVDGVTPVDWNIVETSHNIEIDTYANLGRERSVLGLVVNSNELQVNGNTAAGTGNGLTVTHYLKIDGVLDLEGESQLIQTADSDLDVTSSGVLERDQQGTADLYTYNYWAAPVGVSNTTSNNNNYALPDILNDGTSSSSPTAINWLTSGYDGTSGSPVGIADYWIWKYANQISDNYPSWQHVRSTGSLQPGEGYTMKGITDTGGAISTEQNYVFNGKPHNGDVTLTLSAGNDYLIGNPYASAIDANEFILDNVSDGAGRAASNIIDGTLYFWDHFANASHYLADYEGGYATYNLMGTAVAVSNDTRINNSGAIGTKNPGQYIPVGQGFFVTADTGGTITFKNSQRTFVKEGGVSQFMRSGGSKKTLNINNARLNNSADTREKIKLMFDSPKGYHRQLLVGADQNATTNYDYGYDGILIDISDEDMYWTLGNKKLVIQGINNFDLDQVLPLTLKIEQEGLATIRIDELLNISEAKNIFVHDKELDIYHDLKESDYQIFLTPGEYTSRFEIAFSTGESLGTSDFETSNIDAHYSNAINSIIIINPKNREINTVELTNILGQTVYKKRIKTNENYSELKIKNLSSGAYIIKIKTDSNNFTKKVVVD